MSSKPADPERAAGATGLSRRSVVRAGAGALWVAPVVTLVTAAPSMAASSTLTISGFTAAYQNAANAATVRPDILVVNATLGNSGAQATTVFQFSLSIPAGYYDTAPTATTPTGFTGPSISGSLGSGWTLVYTKSGAQIGAGSSVAFDSTITFLDTAASPFRGYRGSAFSLAGTASATNATTLGGAASVGITPNATLSGSLSVGTNAGNGPAFTMTGSNVRVSRNTAASRSGIGQLSLAVSIPKGTGGSRLTNEPTQGSVGAGWVSAGTAHTAGAWVFKYVTTALGYAGSLGPDDASRGPLTFSSALTMNGGGGNPGGTATWTFTAEHLNTSTTTSGF
jgi:hypothetical protein